MDRRDGQRRVVVVDDYEPVADLYASWLADDYDVTAVYDGTSALESLSEAVDVVLLDRQLPGLSGDEILETVRRRGLDCRVAMVTAEGPDFDVLELGFDDYLCKPVDRDTLRAAVDRLARRTAYSDAVTEYFAAVRKRDLLAAEKSDADLATHAGFEALESRIRDLERQTADLADEFHDDDFKVLFYDVERLGGECGGTPPPV